MSTPAHENRNTISEAIFHIKVAEFFLCMIEWLKRLKPRYMYKKTFQKRFRISLLNLFVYFKIELFRFKQQGIS